MIYCKSYKVPTKEEVEIYAEEHKQNIINEILGIIISEMKKGKTVFSIEAKYPEDLLNKALTKIKEVGWKVQKYETLPYVVPKEWMIDLD